VFPNVIWRHVETEDSDRIGPVIGYPFDARFDTSPDFLALVPTFLRSVFKSHHQPVFTSSHRCLLPLTNSPISSPSWASSRTKSRTLRQRRRQRSQSRRQHNNSVPSSSGPQAQVRAARVPARASRVSLLISTAYAFC
jgi:hypothetical protein